jgi:signal transduction histidine kinase
LRLFGKAGEGRGLIPKSIRGRLLLGGIFFTALALLFASFSINEVLDRFIRRGLNERLDTQIALLVRSVRADGSIDRQILQQIGPFTQHERGWMWRIETPGGMVSSDAFLRLDDRRPEYREIRGKPIRPRADRPWSEATRNLYLRSWRKALPNGQVVITVGAPKAVVERRRQAAVIPLLGSLGALGAFLLIATLVQLRVGLRPLRNLKSSLAEVRAGTRSRITGDQPAELRDMVDELNGLLDENAAALDRARGHVANLAHGLKTPLATLSLRLNEPGRDTDGELAGLVAQIDNAIRHHLGRARAASPGAPGQPQVDLSGAVAELVSALGHIHAGAGIEAAVSITPETSVKCDPQDLDEMLGNLLDNAWRWARSQLVVSAATHGAFVHIDIDDDGPGLSSEAIDRALVRGMRLDERGDGHGFGLSIARELAELHGGTLDLGPSPLGGLRASLVLPA